MVLTTPDGPDPLRNSHHANRHRLVRAAALLKIKEKTVREWIGRGELEAYKIGKEWRVRRDHLDEAIEARRVGGQAASPGGLWDPADRDER
jgi:excisionase family DNA binding protein